MTGVKTVFLGYALHETNTNSSTDFRNTLFVLVKAYLRKSPNINSSLFLTITSVVLGPISILGRKNVLMQTMQMYHYSEAIGDYLILPTENDRVHFTNDSMLMSGTR